MSHLFVADESALQGLRRAGRGFSLRGLHMRRLQGQYLRAPRSHSLPRLFIRIVILRQQNKNGKRKEKERKDQKQKKKKKRRREKDDPRDHYVSRAATRVRYFTPENYVNRVEARRKTKSEYCVAGATRFVLCASASYFGGRRRSRYTSPRRCKDTSILKPIVTYRRIKSRQRASLFRSFNHDPRNARFRRPS